MTSPVDIANREEKKAEALYRKGRALVISQDKVKDPKKLKAAANKVQSIATRLSGYGWRAAVRGDTKDSHVMYKAANSLRDASLVLIDRAFDERARKLGLFK